MERNSATAEVQTSQPILNLQAEALSASTLKGFYDKNKADLDLDKDGFIKSSELDQFKSKHNPISREYRQADALSANVRTIQKMSRDESGFLVFYDSKGISAKDMVAFANKAKSTPGDPDIKSVNDGLASKNYEDVVKNAKELNEERVHLVDFKMQKHSFSLDLFDHLENMAKAEYKTTLVGERQFDKYKKGDTVSHKADYLNFLFNEELSSYSVSVHDKRIETGYNWVDGQKKAHELSAPVFKELREELKRHGRTLIDTPYAGSTTTHISEKSLSDMNIVSRQPMNRYFVDVEISNSSFTLDWTKHLRNLTTSHRVEMEVPKNLYEQSNKVWDPKLSVNSFIIGGRVSSMHGDIKRKWTEVDPDYEQVTTDTGHNIILPKKKP